MWGGWRVDLLVVVRARLLVAGTVGSARPRFRLERVGHVGEWAGSRDEDDSKVQVGGTVSGSSAHAVRAVVRHSRGKVRCEAKVDEVVKGERRHSAGLRRALLAQLRAISRPGPARDCASRPGRERERAGIG